MRYALVTGAYGFIGEQLCALLRQHGVNVRRLGHHPVTNQLDAFNMDLKVDDCPAGLCEGIDTVFHLAGKAHVVADRPEDEAEYWQINTEGTRKLLQAAKQADVQCFVFFSSVKAVGDTESEQPMDETVTTPADTSYGQSKYEAEQLVLHGAYIPNPVVIRPSMVYGNTDKGNLPRMIKAIQHGLFPPLPNTQNRRSMVHVQDVVRAAILAAEKSGAKGQVYIVTDGQSYSTRQIYDWIRTALGKSRVNWAIPLYVLNGLAKIGDISACLMRRRFLFDSAALQKLTGSAWYSSAKIERELGFYPQFTLPQSLPDILRFLNSK